MACQGSGDSIWFGAVCLGKLCLGKACLGLGERIWLGVAWRGEERSGKFWYGEVGQEFFLPPTVRR